MADIEQDKVSGIFRSEMALWIGLVTTLLFLAFGGSWTIDLSNPLKYGLLFIIIFVSYIILIFD